MKTEKLIDKSLKYEIGDWGLRVGSIIFCVSFSLKKKQVLFAYENVIKMKKIIFSNFIYL